MITITKRQYNIGLAVWTIIILVLLLLPASSFSNTPKFINIPHADKIVHFGLFGVLSFLLYHNLRNIKQNFLINKYLLTVIVVSLFGFLTEVLQGLMYNTAKRSFSLYDWLFDTISAILMVFCLYLYYRHRKK